MASRTPLIAAVVAIVVLALAGGTVASLLEARRASAEAAELRERVAELEKEVAELEAAGGSGPLDGLLDGLLGDSDGGLLDGLLGGGDLDALRSGTAGEVAGARCLTPGAGDGGGEGGPFEGLLDGLLGGGDDAPVPDDPDALVDHVAGQVEDLRELTFTDEVDVRFLDDAELRDELDRVLEDQLDSDELAARTDALVALRALPPGSDLVELQRDLLDGQVAGYYAPEDGDLVVRTPEGRIRTIDRITLAHELDHALVDQNVGLPDLDGDDDATLAELAVVEGDATLLMHLWTLEHLPLRDQVGLLGAGDLAGQQEQLASFPHHLQRELLFPYTAGLELVCDRWLEGGWSAVDDAYADPPRTTAGVLDPSRADESPERPPALSGPDGATAVWRDSFGAAPLSWLFEAPGGDPEAALDEPVSRALAWRGGEVRTWTLDGDTVAGLALAADPDADHGLCGSVRDWLDAALPEATIDEVGADLRAEGDGPPTVVRCDEEGVRVGVGPTVEVATAVLGGTA
jgi:hypothetical protein